MPERRLDAAVLRGWAHSAVDHLIRHADEINALNVFPVADADTGTNMLFTMRAALAEAESPHGGADVADVSAALARGAHNGARGNSGVILSQILRALAEVTADAARPAGLGEIDAALFGATLRHAVALVVAAMGGEAVDGTVVSVLQAAAAAVEQAADDHAGLPDALAAAGDAATRALDRTPGQLAVLAEAGVVDAGGLGLLVLLDAMTETVTGHAPERRIYRPADPATHHHAVAEAAPAQFEVMYLLGGCDTAGLDRLRAVLDGLGDSVALAAAAADRHSVHVHTDDAGAAVEAGMAVGAVKSALTPYSAITRQKAPASGVPTGLPS